MDEAMMDNMRETIERHRATLEAIPGCTGTAIGFKTVKGELTSTLAIMVFVQQKLAVVDPAHAVPSTLDGMPTDVVEKEFGFELTATDPFKRFDQLFSGISTTPRERPRSYGTMGCFIKTDGEAPHGQVPANVYALTNQHVYAAADPMGPSRVVLQPGGIEDGNAPSKYECGEYVYGIQDAVNDCAIASIGDGRTYRNEVPNSPLRPGRRDLKGLASASPGDEVYKYGATSRYTRGTVKCTNMDINTNRGFVRGMIYVEAPAGMIWSAAGDSGSVVVRFDDDMVLGLHFAGDSKTQLKGDPDKATAAGYAYDIKSQLKNFGKKVTLAPNPR